MTPIDRIKSRCTVDEITGCWIWKGGTSPSNGGKFRQPRIHSEDYTADPTGKTKAIQTGNRAAWHAYTKKPIPDGYRVFKANHCHDGLCVNPAHLKCGTFADWGRSIAEKAVWRGVSARINANRLSGRKRAGLTPEQVLEVQTSDEKGVVIAKRLGVSQQLISDARNQRLAYVRQTTGNPWGGLLS